MLMERVFIAIEAVFADFQIQIGAVICHTLRATLYQVAHRLKCPVVVVNHHTVAVDAGANAVVEHQWHAIVEHTLEVVVVFRVFRLRHDDAAHLVLEKRFADFHLALIFLIALRHQYAVALQVCLLFNAAEHRRKIVVNKFRQNHAYHFCRAQTGVAKLLGYDIRIIIMFARELLNLLTLLATDVRTVF